MQRCLRHCWLRYKLRTFGIVCRTAAFVSSHNAETERGGALAAFTVKHNVPIAPSQRDVELQNDPVLHGLSMKMASVMSTYAERLEALLEHGTSFNSDDSNVKAIENGLSNSMDEVVKSTLTKSAQSPSLGGYKMQLTYILEAIINCFADPKWMAASRVGVLRPHQNATNFRLVRQCAVHAAIGLVRRHLPAMDASHLKRVLSLWKTLGDAIPLTDDTITLLVRRLDAVLETSMNANLLSGILGYLASTSRPLQLPPSEFSDLALRVVLRALANVTRVQRRETESSKDVLEVPVLTMPGMITLFFSIGRLKLGSRLLPPHWEILHGCVTSYIKKLPLPSLISILLAAGGAGQTALVELASRHITDKLSQANAKNLDKVFAAFIFLVSSSRQALKGEGSAAEQPEPGNHW